jgi:hypothetical protein
VFRLVQMGSSASSVHRSLFPGNKNILKIDFLFDECCRSVEHLSTFRLRPLPFALQAEGRLNFRTSPGELAVKEEKLTRKQCRMTAHNRALVRLSESPRAFQTSWQKLRK